MPPKQMKQVKGSRAKAARSVRKGATAGARGTADSGLQQAPPGAVTVGLPQQQLYFNMTGDHPVLVDPAVGAAWTSPQPVQPHGGVGAVAPTPLASNRVVYLLVTEDFTHSYIGMTNDMGHRLRQHNMEIKGGAWSTSLQVRQGRRWIRAMHVQGFSSNAAAQNFEAKWKQVNKKQSNKLPLIEQKMLGLRKAIAVSGEHGLSPVWGGYIDLTWEDNDYAI